MLDDSPIVVITLDVQDRCVVLNLAGELDVASGPTVARAFEPSRRPESTAPWWTFAA